MPFGALHLGLATKSDYWATLSLPTFAINIIQVSLPQSYLGFHPLQRPGYERWVAPIDRNEVRSERQISYRREVSHR